MWVVFEIEQGLEPTDELFKLYGPFDSEHDAEHYCQLRDFDGVLKVNPPDQ